jgi:hypothetical protein
MPCSQFRRTFCTPLGNIIAAKKKANSKDDKDEKNSAPESAFAFAQKKLGGDEDAGHTLYLSYTPPLSCTLPLIHSHSTSHTLHLSCTPPLMHSTSHALHLSYTPPLIHSTSHTLYLSYTPPLSLARRAQPLFIHAPSSSPVTHSLMYSLLSSTTAPRSL